MEANLVSQATTWHPLGAASFAVLADAKDTEGAFSLLEFRGEEGAWTVPHMHHAMEESFYILDGSFVFTVDGHELEATAGSYVLVHRGQSHVINAGPGGGRFLCLAVPAGLEEMFRELSRLPAGSITDPEVRTRISSRYDSIPVT